MLPNNQYSQMVQMLSNDEIIDELLKVHNFTKDSELAKHYGVERQQIRQFRDAKRIGLTQKIITELLDRRAYKEIV